MQESKWIIIIISNWKCEEYDPLISKLTQKFKYTSCDLQRWFWKKYLAQGITTCQEEESSHNNEQWCHHFFPSITCPIPQCSLSPDSSPRAVDHSGVRQHESYCLRHLGCMYNSPFQLCGKLRLESPASGPVPFCSTEPHFWGPAQWVWGWKNPLPQGLSGFPFQ